MIKTIHSGERMPFFYGKIGPAYYMYEAYETALIPVNYLYKLWYSIIRKWSPAKWEMKIKDIKIHAFNEGYKRGEKRGYYEGYRKSVITQINTYRQELKKLLKEKYNIEL